MSPSRMRALARAQRHGKTGPHAAIQAHDRLWLPHAIRKGPTIANERGSAPPARKPHGGSSSASGSRRRTPSEPASCPINHRSTPPRR